MNDLDVYSVYFMHYALAGFSGGEAQEDKLHACFCLCAIQHVTWYMCILLACYSQVSHKISWPTLLAHMYNCQV